MYLGDSGIQTHPSFGRATQPALAASPLNLFSIVILIFYIHLYSYIFNTFECIIKYVSMYVCKYLFIYGMPLPSWAEDIKCKLTLSGRTNRNTFLAICFTKQFQSLKKLAQFCQVAIHSHQSAATDDSKMFHLAQSRKVILHGTMFNDNF